MGRCRRRGIRVGTRWTAPTRKVARRRCGRSSGGRCAGSDARSRTTASTIHRALQRCRCASGISATAVGRAIHSRLAARPHARTTWLVPRAGSVERMGAGARRSLVRTGGRARCTRSARPRVRSRSRIVVRRTGAPMGPRRMGVCEMPASAMVIARTTASVSGGSATRTSARAWGRCPDRAKPGCARASPTGPCIRAAVHCMSR